MKNSITIFLAGVLLGSVLALLINDKTPGAKPAQGPDRVGTENQPRGFAESSSRTLQSPRNSQNKIRKTPPGGEDLLTYLAYLRDRRKWKPDEAANFLQMARFWNQIGELNDAESHELITAIFEEKEQLGETDLTGISAGLAFMRWCELDGPGAFKTLSEGDQAIEAIGGRFVRLGMKSWTETTPEGALQWLIPHLAEIEKVRDQASETNLGEIPKAVLKYRVTKIVLADYLETTGENLDTLWAKLSQNGLGDYTREQLEKATSME